MSWKNIFYQFCFYQFCFNHFHVILGDLNWIPGQPHVCHEPKADSISPNPNPNPNL